MTKLFLFGLFLCVLVNYSSSATLNKIKKTIARKTSSKFISEGDQDRDAALEGPPKPDPSLKTVLLDDPQNCLQNCTIDYAIDLLNETLLPFLDILSDTLNNTNLDLDSNVTSDADDKKLEKLVVDNLGSMFTGMCHSAKNGLKCAEKCQNAKAQPVIKTEFSTGLAMCAITKYPNATDFLKALDCINSTGAEDTCSAKCGDPPTFTDVTDLNIDDSPDQGFKVTYLADTKQNTANVTNACKVQTCYIECAEPIITKACGQLASDTFRKMSTRENKIGLAALKSFGAVDNDVTCGGNKTQTD